MSIDRRRFLAVAAGLLTLPRVAAAAVKPRELGWADLIPPTETRNLAMAERALKGFVPHGGGLLQERTPADIMQRLRTELDGAYVKIPGYALPLDYREEGTRQLLLVPYVGACIHVPPPPPNQILLVTSETPIKFESMFEAIWVTGEMKVGPVSNDLADVGYRLAADAVEAYEF